MKGELKEAEARRQGEELCQEREWDRVGSTGKDEEGVGREWDPWRHVDVWVPSVNVSFTSEAEKIDSVRKAFEPRGGDEVTNTEQRHEADAAVSDEEQATVSNEQAAVSNQQAAVKNEQQAAVKNERRRAEASDERQHAAVSDEPHEAANERGQQVSLEELIQKVKRRWQEEQQQVDEEGEARQESERQGNEENEEVKWETGKGKGPRVVRRREGKGRGRMTDEQMTWEEWWAAKEKSWTDEEWKNLSSDDLSMGETGRGLRQEQWEEVRGRMVRGENTRMAERLGGGVGRRIERLLKKTMDNVSRWRKKVWRLTGRLEGLERGKRREERNGMSMGSSSTPLAREVGRLVSYPPGVYYEVVGAGGGMARRGGSKWGHQRTINSRLRRKMSTKRMDEWMHLKSKVEWLEAEKGQQQ